MIVLGLDTATPDTVVGLLDTATGTVLGEARHRPAPGARPGHAEQLLALARAELAAAGLAFADVGRIAVGRGPGTFTGLRIGLATAHGLARATGAELVGVSTLQALAAGAGPARRMLAVIDARRGEAFVAGFEDGAPVVPAAAVAPEALGGLGGPGWSAVGDGALRFRAGLEAAGCAVAPDDSPQHLVAGAALCRLGAAADPPDARDPVLPDYLRPPDAARRTT